MCSLRGCGVCAHLGGVGYTHVNYADLCGPRSTSHHTIRVQARRRTQKSGKSSSTES